jgi:hypothetical protein
VKRQNQQLIKTLETRMPHSSEESWGENYTPPRSYRSPRVLLVGKAQRLMASSAAGSVYDGQGLYTYP